MQGCLSAGASQNYRYMTPFLLLCSVLHSGQVVMAAASAQVRLWETALQQLSKLPTTKTDPDQLVDTSNGHLAPAFTFMQLSKVNTSVFSKLVALKVRAQSRVPSGVLIAADS